MAVPKKGKAEGPPIIVKKITVVAAGHHGGAWKVAYADFVTAMMAFFLLLWLLGATNEKQRKGIADYFTPTLVKLRQESAGSNGLLGGSSITDADNYPNRAGQTGNRTITIPRDMTGGPKEAADRMKQMQEKLMPGGFLIVNKDIDHTDATRMLNLLTGGLIKRSASDSVISGAGRLTAGGTASGALYGSVEAGRKLTIASSIITPSP